MIWQPKKGQHIRVHYRKSMTWMPYHGKCGVVVRAGHGKGPRNALVALSGRLVVIPRGNLQADRGRQHDPLWKYSTAGGSWLR